MTRDIDALIGDIAYARARNGHPCAGDEALVSHYYDLLVEAEKALEVLRGVSAKEMEWFESVRDLVDAAILLSDVAEDKASCEGYPAINWALGTVSSVREHSEKAEVTA